jgi:hypothetical protein
MSISFPTFAALEEALDDTPLCDLDDSAHRRLLELRGGCTCFVFPPCWRCVNQITEHEAEELGLIEEPEPQIDYMGAVRAMCKGMAL